MASSNIKVTVTNAGISAMLNAQKTGTEKITITNCKFFSTYKAVNAETTADDLAKLTKVADLDAVGGEQTSKNTIHVDAADSSANAYEVRTVGIYTSAGVLFAVTSSETSILEKVTQSIAMFAADIIIANADVSVLEFDNPSFTTAAATNANAGVIRIATDAEAVAASDGTIALVPSSLNALTANPAWRTYSNKLDYSIGAVCFYSGKLYVAIAANGPSSTVKFPTDGAYWQQIPNLKNVTDTCVTLATAQTIAGAKTFSTVTKSATPAAGASGTEVVTAAWTKKYCGDKWQDIATEHNNIYRGANLLSGHFSSITDVITAISKGDFSDIYVGDYIPASYTVDDTKQTANFRIAGINTLKARVSPWGTQSPNVCIVPDNLGTSNMNDTDTTVGGYVGSKMYTTILPKYYNALAGSASCPFYGHILKTMERLTNAVDTNQSCRGYIGWKGAATGVDNYSNQNLTLMSEIEVYGCTNWSSTGWDDESMCVQLPLFRLKPEIITLNGSLSFWLRSVTFSTVFCFSSAVLSASCNSASNVYGVRPRFFIG